MATPSLTKRLFALKNSRRGRKLSQLEKQSRRSHLERLEDRHLMAVAPPVLVQLDSTSLLNDKDTRNVAPKELNFTFLSVPGIDATTLNSGITLTRAGKDGTFGNNNDVVIQPA